MLTLLNQDVRNIEDENYCLITGEIDGSVSDYVIRFIIEKNTLPEKDRPNHLKLLINSPGGSLTDTFAMIDTINAFPIPVYTYGLGWACSGGLLLLMSGAKGNRYVLKNTTLMSHQWSGIAEGKEHELEAQRREDKNANKKMLRLYEDATGLSKEEIGQKLLPAHDVYLTAQEAVKYGVADKVLVKF